MKIAANRAAAKAATKSNAARAAVRDTDRVCRDAWITYDCSTSFNRNDTWLAYLESTKEHDKAKAHAKEAEAKAKAAKAVADKLAV